MNNNGKKKTSWLGYVLPYLIIIAIVSVVVLIFNLNGRSSKTYYENEIITGVYTTEVESDATRKAELDESLSNSILMTKTVKSISISYYTTFTKLTGTIQDGSSYYTFSADLSNTEDVKNTLSYILRTRTTSSGAQYYVSPNCTVSVVNPYASNFWTDYFPMILLSVVSLGVIIFLFTRMSGAVRSSNNQALDFNKSRAKREDSSSVRFDDVAGCDEEKAEMMELVDYLKNPVKYANAGAKLPKGILLVGNPGTGKTLLAKAVAGEAHVPFYSISGSDFVEMFVGVGAGRVRDMFKKAKQTAPCLIFIDEIDAVGRQRGAGLGGGNDEREQTLNQLLVEMDGFEDNSGIIVIAATNRADILDPALMRAGRFDRQITVGLPDRFGREAILKVHARNKRIDNTVNWANVAKRTVGFSGADLANIVNEAAILAVRNKKRTISIREIDEAIDRRIAGPAKKSKHLNELERRTVAYHEAGHAIIGLTLPASDVVQKVTIVPRGMAGGYVMSVPEDDRFLLTKEELIAEITGLLGGRSSEEVFCKDISTGASNDIERATKIARAMVVEYGMSSLGPVQYESNSGSVFLGRDYTSNQKNFANQIANEIDKEVRTIIDQAHEAAIKIINERKDDVILIAETLLEVETLNGEEINYLLENRKLPDYTEKKVQESNEEETAKTAETETVESKLEETTVEVKEESKDEESSNDSSAN